MQAQLVRYLCRVHGVGQVLGEWEGRGERRGEGSGGERPVPNSLGGVVQVEVRRRLYLFVGEDEQNSIPQLVLCQHPHQLLTSLVHPLAVVAVYHEDQTCGGDERVCVLWSANESDDSRCGLGKDKTWQAWTVCLVWLLMWR